MSNLTFLLRDVRSVGDITCWSEFPGGCTPASSVSLAGAVPFAAFESSDSLAGPPVFAAESFDSEVACCC